MSEEQKKKESEESCGSCCSSETSGCGSCCGGGRKGKFLCGLLAGLLLAGAGFGLYQAGKCSANHHAAQTQAVEAK
ncbi:MAG: hypothetical protein HYT79_08690 [Elusimicrobia bacterium]|nr:hypothetical protein [Elusimicrobiota bacterium]